MSTKIKFKHEIVNAVQKIESEEQNSTSPARVLIEIQETVRGEAESSKSNPTEFKAAWIRRILAVMKELNVASSKTSISENVWKEVISLSPVAPSTAASESSSTSLSSPSSKSSTSSLSYQQSLCKEDLKNINECHDRLQEKWQLKSKRCVEDVMHDKFKSYKFEHVAHSYILEPTANIWQKCFSESELAELTSAEEQVFTARLPERLKTFEQIYDQYKGFHVDRYDDPELYWVTNSILEYLDLFHGKKSLQMKTEQDLLDEVYGFIKRSRNISKLQTETASGSMASSEAKNKKLSVGDASKISRQACGDHADLVFMHTSLEIGCVEIGLEDGGPNATKELQERDLKMPKMMKAFCLRLLEQFPSADKKFVNIVGFVISGMHISTVQMSFSRGSVALVSLSRRYKMPESIEEIPALLPPVLALVYNCALIMKNTSNYLDDVSSKVNLDPPSSQTFLPPVFVPNVPSSNCSTGKKRKAFFS
ncbi:hypothetical protein MBANPS3_010382 [Mucor bainieri]